MTAPLTLPELLDRLGYDGDEHVSINTQTPGGQFTSRIIHHADTGSVQPQDRDAWFGVQPVTPSLQGRGRADDVTRLAAIYADLDIKPGGIADYQQGFQIIDDLSGKLGTQPVAITLSGHGMQPLWAIEDHEVDDSNRSATRATLRRFGRLVSSVADERGAAIDSVFDLARVLRIPGTVNHKSSPVPVATAGATGRPLSFDELVDALDAYSVPEYDDDTADLGAVVNDPATWEWATSTCIYTKSVIKEWAKDTPTERHPWLAGQCVRLAAMRAHGCLTREDHERAATVLIERFRELLTHPPARKEGVGEIADLISFGTRRVAAMTPERVARELGGHDHVEPSRLVSPAAPVTSTEGNLATVHTLQPAAERALHSVPERTLSHSDDANALILIDSYGDLLRHCSDRGRWYSWDSHTWVECPRTSGMARELAKRVARSLPEDDKAEVAHKKRSLSAVGISAMLTQAATDDRITVTYDQLDAHPWELNTPGGIVDLRTGRISPPDPARLHTRSTLCAPDDTADRSVWMQFLTDTFGQDEELISYLQRLMGYSATGMVGAHVLPFAHGSGGNGKGVFLEANMKVLGDYATTAPAGFLMSRAHASHETEIARLSGARMVLCSEVNETDNFDEAKVKQLTGGDTLTARFMHQDHFTFEPTHKLWLMGNHQPNVRSGGRSFWRRLRLIPFTREVDPKKAVDDLQGLLASQHGPAILSWIVEGAVDYYRDGLNDPPAVLAATQEYAHDQDTVARFVEDRCHLDGVGVAREKVAEVRSAYERWCYENGESPVSAKALTTSLAKLGVDSTRTKSARMYTGLTLLSEGEDLSSNLSPNLSPDRSEAAADQGW